MSFRFKYRSRAIGSLIVAGTVAAGWSAANGQVKRAAPPRGPSQAKPAAFDAQDQRIATALSRALQARISSPGGKPKITVKPTGRSAQGYFAEIAVAARPAQIKKLRITSLDLRARNVRINVPKLLQTGKVETLSAQTTLRAVVTEDDLTRLLGQGKHTRDMRLRVRYIGGGQMRVTGNLNYTLLNGSVTGVGRLRLAPNFTVMLDITSLQLRGVEVPQFVKNQFSSRINPVINYQDLPFRPRFRQLIMQGARATLIA